MKPTRFSLFSALCGTGLAVLSLSSASAVEVFFNNSSTDWTVLTGWNLNAAGTGNPTIIPGASGATDYDVNFGVTALNTLSSGRTVNMKDHRTIRLLKTSNINNIITLTTGAASTDTQMFRTLQLTGIDHTRGGLTIGSTTDRQKINLGLLGTTHTWNSATAGSSGSYVGNAIVVLNNVSPVSGSTELILTGSNTGSRVDGSISGAISLVKRGTSSTTVWTLNGDNSFTGTVTVEEGILKLGHGNALPYPSSVSVAAGKTLSLLLVPTFTSERINGFTSQTTYGSTASILEFDTSGSDASYDASVNKAFTLRKINGGTLTLNGNGSFAGPIAVTGGNLLLRGNNTFASTVTLSSGTGLVLDGSNTISTNLNAGANSLSLLGTSTFTGTTGKVTLAGGNLTVQSPSTIVPARDGSNVIIKPIATSGSSTILVEVGATGFSEAQFNDIQAFFAPLTTVASGGSLSYGISTITGDRVWEGALRGTAQFTKGGMGTLTLWGNRTDTGPVAVREGTLRLFNIANGGAASPIGTSSSAAANLILAGGRIAYAGSSNVTTDRLLTMTTGSSLEASGSGTVQFTNTGAIAHTNTTARTLLLTGTNRGQNVIASAIGNAGTSAVSITKQGTGSWWLSGANTATGAVRVDSGELVLDYATSDPLSGDLTTNGGIANLKGKGTSATAETINNVTLTASQTSGSHLKVSDNLQLTINTLTGGGNAQRADFIDLSGNAANSITVGALSGNYGVVNNILMSNGSTTANAGRANVVVRAQDGTYGFPTLSGGSSGTLQKLTTLTEISPGTSIAVNSNTTNYLFKAGTYSSPNNLVFGTMTFDSTNGPVSLDMGIKLITPTGFGKAFLFQGTNNVTVSAAVGNTEAGESSALWFHNYLQPPAKFLLSASLGDASQFAIFGGPGLTDYNGDNFVGNMLIMNGVLRISKTQGTIEPYPADPSAATGANFKASNGGVFEIGANVIELKEKYDFDFARPIGSTSGMVRLLGDSGFSAYREGGGTRIIQFSRKVLDWSTLDVGYEAQSLSWGRGYFLTTPESENGDGEYALKLSSAYSNATVEIRNTIDLNGKQRPLDVANGSATVDAHLAGNLTGNTYSGIVKIGAGTLKLSGINTFKGEARIQEGKLMADSASFDPACTIRLESGGSLELATDVEVAAVYVNGTRRYGSDITATNIIGPGKLKTAGTLTGYPQWVVDKALETKTEPGDDYDGDGILNLVEYATGTEPKLPNGSALKITGSTTRQIQFNHMGRTDLKSVLQASPTLGGTWTDIAVSTAGGAFSAASGVTGVSVSTSGTTISVTDSRTPAASVMFYRVRYEIVN